ncbi:MAG: Loki-CTERM sorting domain-containing protein [Promethearchaeota archaeon]
MEGTAKVQVIKGSSEEPPPEPPGIPGYDVYLLLGALSVISALLVRKRVKS